MIRRTRFTSRLILASMAVPLMAVKVTAQIAPAPQQGEVTFDSRERLVDGAAAAVRSLARRDGLNEDLAEVRARAELKDAVICAVPTEPSSADLYYRLNTESGASFRQVMTLARTMHGYAGWAKQSKLPIRELLCHLKAEIGDKDQGFAAGDHYPAAGFSRIGTFYSIINAVGTVFHENVHKLFYTANKAMLAAFTKQGGDSIALNLLDEGNAFARTMTSLYIKQMELEEKGKLSKEDRALHKDITLALTAYKDTRQALILSSLVELYGRRDVLRHVATHGHLPPIINRISLIGFMDELAGYKSYQHATDVRLRIHGNNTLVLDDGQVRQVMEYDGANYYGHMQGMTQRILPHLKLMFAKTSDEFKAGLDAKVKEDKGIGQALGDTVLFLSRMTQDSPCVNSALWVTGKLLSDHRDSPLFKADFMRDDLKFLFFEAIKRIDAIPELDRGRGHTVSTQLKNRLMDMVEHVQHVLLDGVPVNPAIVNAPLPGLTKGYHAAGCG